MEAKKPLTPTQELSLTIAEELCKVDLIPAAKKEELSTKLNAGTITSDDWRLLIEMALPKKELNDAAKA